MKCCFRCGHVFNHKSNLNRHLLKKIPCEVKYLNISGPDIIANFIYYYQQFQDLTGNTLESPSRELIKLDVPVKMVQVESESEEEDEYVELDNVEDDMVYKCEGCRKEFNKKNNYYRHRKSYCPVLKDDYKELKTFKKNLDNQYRQMRQEHINKQSEPVNQNHNQNKFENSLNNYNTKAHNYQLKQNTQDVYNKNEFNITINEYGKEDVSSVSQSEWKQIVKKLYCALPDLVKKVHFDIETNRNVYVPNIREKYAMVWKNGNWEMMDIREVLDDLLVNNTDRIYEFLEENEGFLGDTLSTKMNSIIEKIGSSKKLQKKYQDQIKMILINNRSVVKNTYEIESGKKLEIK